MPVTGLSVHKPSPLWPPPSNDISDKVHSGLRKGITDVLRRHSKGASSRVPQAVHPMDPDNTVLKAPPRERNVQSISSLPLPGVPDADQRVSFQTAEGKTIEVAQQIQLYVPNGLLKHPLASPALSYLGGLPPLLFIAGDREVLRDEIIYT
jgi:alpha/beta hydrolase fold